MQGSPPELHAVGGCHSIKMGIYIGEDDLKWIFPWSVLLDHTNRGLGSVLGVTPPIDICCAIIKSQCGAETRMLDILRLIAEHVLPNPFTYMRLSTVSREFNTVFTSDFLWRQLDPYGVEHEIYRAFCDRYKKESVYNVYLLIQSWSGGLVHDSDDLYIQLGHFAHQQGHKTTNKQLVSCAVRFQGTALRYAHPSIRQDYNIVLNAVMRDGMALGWASQELCRDLTIARVAISRNLEAIRFVDYELATSNRELSLILIQFDVDLLEYTKFTNDTAIVMHAVGIDGRSLRFASSHLRDSLEVVSKAIQTTPEAIQFASPRLMYNKQLLLQVIPRLRVLFHHIDPMSAL